MTPKEIEQVLSNAEHRREIRQKYEPLQADPEWSPTPDGSYHSLKHGGLGTIKFPPVAYAQGFEAGAFALADRLLPMLAAGKLTEAFVVLGGYEERNAQPVRGWKHAPSRG